MEQELRKSAIERYLNGESPKTIYTDINRSKNWFFKWLRRYKSGAPDWFKDHSRAPINRPTQISQTEKQRIISVRTHLESQKLAQIGPSAIKWELSKSGHRIPSDSTIKRVLKEEGLIKKKLHTLQRALSIHILLSRLTITTFIRPISLVPDILKKTVNFIRST
jgi:hypothetical protein